MRVRVKYLSNWEWLKFEITCILQEWSHAGFHTDIRSSIGFYAESAPLIGQHQFENPSQK